MPMTPGGCKKKKAYFVITANCRMCGCIRLVSCILARMIQQQAQYLDSLSAPAPAPCRPKIAPSVPVQNCSSTAVRGLLGTG